MRNYDPELEDNRDIGDLSPFEDPNRPANKDDAGLGSHPDGPTAVDQGGNSQTPRERESERNPNAAGAASTGNYQSAVPQSSSPRPAQGVSSMFGGSGRPGMVGAQAGARPGVQTFEPMSATPSGAPAEMSSEPIGHAGSGSSRLFGALGGLKGGGLGVPSSMAFDPNGEMEISQLIQKMQRRKGLF